jgi:CheY-like chemotaxis protein
MSRCYSRYPAAPRPRARATGATAPVILDPTTWVVEASAASREDAVPPPAAQGTAFAEPWRAAQPQRRATATGPILIVDDDPALLDVIAAILKQEGYAIATATNGADALRAVDQQPPALVLLDMRMPVLDGWEFARQLEDRGLDVPIIVMTAAQDAARWAQEVSAAACLAKPFELNDLLDAIDRMLAP